MSGQLVNKNAKILGGGSQGGRTSSNEKSRSASAAGVENFGEDSIDPQELAALLEQSGGTESGCAQIVDGDGNLITLTAEQLSAAGIDIQNLGESDVQALLQLAQGTHHAGGHPPAVTDASIAPATSAGGRKRPVETSVPSAVDFEQEAESGSGTPLHQLKKRKFSPSANISAPREATVPTESSASVAAEAEDLTELDEQTIASLVQSGSVKFVDEEGNEIPPSALLASGTHVVASNIGKTGFGLGSKLSRPPLKPPQASAFSLIGMEVDIKRGNRTVPATVRYIRPGVGYKVQFEDGRFEWVGESDVTPRTSTAIDQQSSNNVEDVSRTDEGYSQLDDQELVDDLGDEGAATFRTPQPPASSLGGGASSRPPRSRGRPPSNGVVSTYAGRRSVFSTSNIGHKLGQHGRNFGSAAVKSSSSSSAVHQHQRHSGTGGHDTNFICPVCERKVYNKEPSYIVIRLPACDECAESKILVLDEPTTK